MLQKGEFSPKELVDKHLMPNAQVEFGRLVGENVKEDYAMMDTSDGLMDALSVIAKESGVLLEVDFDKFLHNSLIENYENWQNSVLFGGEDYGIIAAIPEKYNFGTKIGTVKIGEGVDLHYNNKIVHYSEQDVVQKVFNHFE